MFEPLIEGAHVQLELIDQIRLRSIGLGIKGGVAMGGSEAVPGADCLADVAAEDPIAKARPQGSGNILLELDGQVGNAATRVDGTVWQDAIGRAGVDAARTGATLVCRERRIRLKLEIEKDLCQQEIRSMIWADEAGVFADPAEAGPLCQVSLQDRARV